MGFMDSFTSDGVVEMKHGEYYELMRKAAVAELTMNAVKCNVPHDYIQAMVTGTMPENIIIAEAVLESKADPGTAVTFIGDVIKAAKNCEELEALEELLYKCVSMEAGKRRNEIIIANDEALRAVPYEVQAQEEDQAAAVQAETPDLWSCETCQNRRNKRTAEPCKSCEDGSGYVEANPKPMIYKESEE